MLGNVILQVKCDKGECRSKICGKRSVSKGALKVWWKDVAENDPP